MSQFTKNFEEFNREHPVMDEASAEVLASAFPETEHLSLQDPGSLPDSSLAEQKDRPQVVALLPVNKTSKVQNALAEAFQSLLKSKNNLAAVDMDISSPRSELLGTENSEGLTDHFLYGVSPSKILRDSKQPGLKVITPGTFTPRAVEIYENPHWKLLINWLAKETGLTVVLLAPPMERLKDLPPLIYADTVVLFSEPLPKDQPLEELRRIMETISRNSAPESSIRMLWLGEREAEPEEPETAEAPVEEPVHEELDTAELEMEEEPEQIKVPEPEPTDTPEVPEEPAGVDLEEVPAEELEPVAEAQTEETTSAPEAEKSLKDEEDQREDRGPGEPEPPVSAAETEAPAAAEPAKDHEPPEEEEEIFLPDELLFLDEEETPAGAGKGSDEGLEAEQLAELNYEELPDMKTQNDKEDQPSEPEEAASAPAREDQDAVTADAGASTEEASPAEPGDIDPEALYTETEPEEIKTLEEAELEPAEESAAEETEPEPAAEETAAKPASEEAVEEQPAAAAEEAKAEEPVTEAPAEPEKEEQEAVKEAEPAGEEPEKAAEAAAEPVESAAEPATKELVELDDEGAPAAAAATDGESNTEGEQVVVEAEEDVPPADESELEGDELDIDLGELEGEEVAPPVQKKKPAKSKSRPVVFLVLVLGFLFGMFYIWQQGIVSQLVRDHFPNLSGMLGISSSSLPEQVLGTVDEQGEAEDTQEATAMAQQEEGPESLEYPRLGYSIQLGSFHFLNRANEARDQLADIGFRDAYVVPLKLDSLGDWNRLYLGFYGTKAAADTALSRAGGALRKFAGDAIIRETPYALLIGDFPTADALNLERNRLTESNIPSYSVLLKPDSTQTSIYRLFVGAFKNKEQAILLRTRLFNLGFKAEITERRGGAGKTG